MIHLQNVCYAYGGRPALADVTLEIGRGESVALLGANGSGKSTLLKLLNGLLEPTGGTYTFDGEVISRKRLRDAAFSKGFHAKIGFVFQNSDTQLFCPTVYDEVAFAPRQMGLPEGEVKRRVDDLLALLGIAGFGELVPYHLSGGEQKKVALAAELAKGPSVLTLDEWAAGLDPRTERNIAGFLMKLGAAGATLIMATHDLEMAKTLTSRAVIFSEEHRVIADLPSARLLDDLPLLRRANLI